MSDRILGAVAVAAASAMAWAAADYAPPFSYEPVGPRAFPLLLAAAMALLGLWLIVKPAPHQGPWRVRHLAPTAGAMAAVFAFALLFEVLGFAVATAAMAVPLGMAFGGTWKQALSGGVVMGLALFFVFDRALDVVLPTGLLAFALGGR